MNKKEKAELEEARRFMRVVVRPKIEKLIARYYELGEMAREVERAEIRKELYGS